jgi:hypothetical protein
MMRIAGVLKYDTHDEPFDVTIPTPIKDPTPAMNEALAFARQLQERHDLRNSELVTTLLAVALSILNPK